MTTDAYWTSKPPPGTRLNRRHPLTRDLVACWAFNDGRDGGQLIREQAGWLANVDFTTNSGATWSGRDGGGLSFTNPQALRTTSSPPDWPFLGPITVIVRGLIRTGSTYHELVCKVATAGTQSNPFEFRTNNAATPALAMVRATTGGTFVFREYTGPSVTLNTVQTWGVTADSSQIVANYTFYVDGVPTAGSNTDGTGSGFVAGTNADFFVGRRIDGVVQLDGEISFVGIWNRVLTTPEHAMVASSPYALFEPPGWRRPVRAAGSGARSMVVVAG